MLTTGTTGVMTRAVLLDMTWSMVADATEATLVTLPALSAVIVMVTVARVPIAMLPKVQLTAPLALVQLPRVVLTVPKLIPAGTRFVRVAAVAVSGPLFVTLRV